MRLTVALTNGNKELPSGPAHRRNRRRWRHPRPSRPDTAPGGGLAALEALPLTSPRLPPALTCDFRLFWAPLAQLARSQTPTMFPVKVKVEKSGEDPEVGAR